MDVAPRTPPPGQAHVLIAVKDLDRAKSRLAPRLGPADRNALVLAMLRDTLAAARSAPAVGEVTVITPDATVAEAAEAAGARWYRDPEDPGGDGLNGVLRAAARVAASRVADGPLVALQGDLPCLAGTELSEALDRARSYPRAIVVDHHGTGTSALIVGDPSTEFDPRFGAGSARRHLDSGATALAGNWPGLRLDVDTAADLDAAAVLGPGPATAETLHRIGWQPGYRRSTEFI
ncbi:2-phospho-L-lactate guanylyltransferase [Rhodococcus spelaei]|uniref:Phosphoenolpyruvate guanylyltransferase n=1 Tax=Rhodococcus spelaei TaxID=2546320 RepID=A0A541B4C9_9NOCA|nr:2-phospho-L-lactate guanylyltransferase [Rhodococcus spelaei]TQF67156.1 2-phospho-L-lactate guanylyltransferase [Rhodococcus spelaei]